MVGVLLPSTVGGALVKSGLTLRGAVPVNLNFTAGAEAMQSAIEQCGIRTVITSRAFLAKAKLEPLPGTVYIEDLLKAATPFAKLRAWLAARFAPAALLSRGRRTPDSPGRRHLLQRLHRRPQGRHALALQPDQRISTPSPSSSGSAPATASWACCPSSIPSGSR